MARYRSDASPSCRPWQDCAPMRSRRGLGQEKRQFVAIYRRHVFRFSYFWQDMRAMHPKSPAKCRWGIHRANILPPRGVFAVRRPQIVHGARILATLRWPRPCAGAPARAAASRDRLSTARPLCRDGLPYGPWFADPSQRPGPCSGGAYPPAPRQCSSPADTRHLPRPSQSETSRR